MELTENGKPRKTEIVRGFLFPKHFVQKTGRTDFSGSCYQSESLLRIHSKINSLQSKKRIQPASKTETDLCVG